MNEMKKIIDSIMNNSNSISSETNNYLQEDNNSSNENLIIEKRSNLGENQFQEVTELVNENESLRIESTRMAKYYDDSLYDSILY